MSHYAERLRDFYNQQTIRISHLNFSVKLPDTRRPKYPERDVSHAWHDMQRGHSRL